MFRGAVFSGHGVHYMFIIELSNDSVADCNLLVTVVVSL